MLRQLTTRLPRATSQLRTFTTVRTIDEPSANYRPGKEGFAPGMPHPPGSSPAPSPPPAPRTVEDLPEMSKSHDHKAHGSPTQKFELEMTKLRHAYQREHFQGQDALRTEKERQRKGSLRRLQLKQAGDREDNEKRLEFERLMQPAGSSGPERHERFAQFVQERKAQRVANFQKREEAASEERLESMVRLYHAAEDFVTFENLDAKVNEFFEAGKQGKVYVPTVQDMVVEVNEGGGKISHADLVSREQELRDALDGTVSGGKIGIDAVKAKVESS
ncbi:hypothetical protein BGZ83_005413 [Gryganskiella cystojenkinii]|nr:hypothetical protein BGZ83_005413 [Gryganskiella cystojenkinii]